MLANCVCFALLVLGAYCQNFLQINGPTPQQTVSNGQAISIQYTIIGGQTTNPPITNANYPASLTVYFQWSQKSNTGNVMNLTALSGLSSDPYPAGAQNKAYSGKSWKLPNCHFFSRYTPAQYDFGLVFSPQYPPPSATTVNTNQGPQQQSMTVTLNVQVNNASFPKC